MFLRKVILGAALLFFIPAHSSAAESELKPGDVIGPHNWQRVQGMVGENLLNRIKGGYTFKIKESRPRREPKEYIEATEKYASKVTLGTRGELVNYVAGRPFPTLSASDPEAGLKLAWNFVKRWMGDDYKDGGGTATGRAASYTIEKDGSERKSEVIRHEIRTRGRVTLDPKPSFAGYDHIDWMVLRADEYPRDTSGTTTLEIRYMDPDREDDLYVYVPSIRRVRRSPPTERCATLAPTEFNFDDINTFNGKVTNFKYKFLGERQMLGNFFQQQIPYARKPGDYLPLNEAWEVVNAYTLEIVPKDSSYCYPHKVLYIDTLTLQAFWGQILDIKGNLWKEQINFYAPVKLVDGQEVLSPMTPVIVNVQNGRSSVLNTARAFNQGYQPSLFTLQTLQTVMRGGSVR
jgi:Protein of unknown function (DUF1329)